MNWADWFWLLTMIVAFLAFILCALQDEIILGKLRHWGIGIDRKLDEWAELDRLEAERWRK